MDLQNSLRQQMYWQERLTQNLPIFSACAKIRKMLNCSSFEERNKYAEELIKAHKKKKDSNFCFYAYHNDESKGEKTTGGDDDDDEEYEEVEEEDELLDEVWTDKCKFIEEILLNTKKKECFGNEKEEETEGEGGGKRERNKWEEELRQKYIKIFKGGEDTSFLHGGDKKNLVDEYIKNNKFLSEGSCMRETGRAKCEGGDEKKSANENEDKKVPLICDLSDDLFIKIFTFLKRPARTLGRAALVSSRIKEIAENGDLWKFLFFERFAKKMGNTAVEKYASRSVSDKTYGRRIENYYRKMGYKYRSAVHPPPPISSSASPSSSVTLPPFASCNSCTVLAVPSSPQTSSSLPFHAHQKTKNVTVFEGGTQEEEKQEEEKREKEKSKCFSSSDISDNLSRNLSSSSSSSLCALPLCQATSFPFSSTSPLSPFPCSSPSSSSDFHCSLHVPSFLPSSPNTHTKCEDEEEERRAEEETEEEGGGVGNEKRKEENDKEAYHEKCEQNESDCSEVDMSIYEGKGHDSSNTNVHTENEVKENTQNAISNEKNHEEGEEKSLNWKIRYGAKHSLEKMFCKGLFDCKISARTNDRQSAILDVEYGSDGSIILAASLNGCIYVISPVTGDTLYAFSLDASHDEQNESNFSASYNSSPSPQTVCFSHNIFPSLDLNYVVTKERQKEKGEFNRNDGEDEENKEKEESLFLRLNETVDTSCLYTKPLIMGGYSDAQIRVWDFLSGKMVCCIKGHNQCITAVECVNKCYNKNVSNEKQNNNYCNKSNSNDMYNNTTESLLLSGCMEGIVKLWDVCTAKQVCKFAGHKGAVNSICFDASNQLILTGSKDRHVHAYDRRSGEKPVLTWPQHKDWVMCVETPGGLLNPYIMRSADKSINTWDLRNPSARICIPSIYSHRHRQLISGVKSDALRLVSCSFDGSIKISSEEHPMADACTLAVHHEWVMSVDFCETQLVAGTIDGRVEIYDFV